MYLLNSNDSEVLNDTLRKVTQKITLVNDSLRDEVKIVSSKLAKLGMDVQLRKDILKGLTNDKEKDEMVKEIVRLRDQMVVLLGQR